VPPVQRELGIDDVADTELGAWATAVAAVRADLATALSAQGHDVVVTAANWLLVRSSAPLRDELAARRVVVRDCTNFGLGGLFRVAVPRPDQLARVVAAFATVAPSR
jgi:histidinol-phosphate/aromatic aminotransferase/cobyric acid decarboxylase-like protein